MALLSSVRLEWAFINASNHSPTHFRMQLESTQRGLARVLRAREPSAEILSNGCLTWDIRNGRFRCYSGSSISV